MNEIINKVFNCDVFDILKKIPDNSIDMIYGDPDYNVGINYNGKNFKKNGMNTSNGILIYLKNACGF